MVPISCLLNPTSGPVGEWMWPDPSNLCEAQFILRTEREAKLRGLLEQSRQSSCGELATTESGLEEALRRVKVARRTVSSELLNVAQVSLNDPFMVFW
jgi:hypothetical protein